LFSNLLYTLLNQDEEMSALDQWKEKTSRKEVELQKQ
jgi:hypothetical protein